MARTKKQVHGKVHTGGKGDTNAGMTKQGPNSEKHQAHLREQEAARLASRKAFKPGRGGRYLYNGVKPGAVVKTLEVLAG